MEGDSVFEAGLTKLCGSECVQKDEPMSGHTTFRTGGPADYFVRPKDRESLLRLLSYLRESGTGYLILGKGSNILGCSGFLE